MKKTKKTTKNYDDLLPAEREKLINKEHVNGCMSITALAEKYNTYPNKVRRDALKFGIKIDDKSKAQKKLLDHGIVPHPTKGKEMQEDTKLKISSQQRAKWDALSDAQKAAFKNNKKAAYKQQKNKMHTSPKKLEAIHSAAKIGSKMELFLFNLISKDFASEHQKEDDLRNQKFHIDIFLTKERIAIEVDGPAHNKAFWGEDKLAKVQAKDFRKDANILEKGYKLIRVINDGKFSLAYGNRIYAELKSIIEQMINGSTKENKIVCHVKK